MTEPNASHDRSSEPSAPNAGPLEQEKNPAVAEGAPPPTSPPAIPEPELRCLNCDYPLRGLTEHRCPECGEPFDPEYLEQIFTGKDVSVLSKPDGTTTTFVEIFGEVLWHPRRFGRRFPARPDRTEGAHYSLLCYATAAVLFAGLTACVELWAVVFVPAICVGALTASWLCEGASAAFLDVILSPVSGGLGYPFWRGLTHYTGGFTLFTALWGGAVLALVDSDSDVVQVMRPLAAFWLFVWWCLTLMVMVRTRVAARGRVTLAGFVVAIVGVGAIVLAGMVSALLALLLHSIRR